MHLRLRVSSNRLICIGIASVMGEEFNLHLSIGSGTDTLISVACIRLDSLLHVFKLNDPGSRF